jgi:lysozyme
MPLLPLLALAAAAAALWAASRAAPRLSRPELPMSSVAPRGPAPSPGTVNAGRDVLAFLTAEEGSVPYAYDDKTGKAWTISRAGNPTIGVGHLILPSEPELLAFTPVRPAPEQLIRDLLARDAARFTRAVDRLGVPLKSNQRAALISLAFNIGEGAFGRSDVAMHVKAGRWQHAADAFRNWHRGNGVPGRLAARRERERALFLA